MSKQDRFAMDSATCLKATDGTVMIKRNTFRNLFALVILGLFLLGIVALLLSSIASLLRGNPTVGIESLFFLILAGVFISVGILALIRSVRIPSIYINTNSKLIEFGRGASARQIPFTSISQIVVDQNPVLNFIEQLTLDSMKVKKMGICINLDDGSTVQLGTVSGDERKLKEHADAVVQLIADATGAAHA